MKHRRPWVAPLGVGLSGILPPQGRKGRKPPASSAEVASPPPAEGIPASPREPGGPVDSAAFAVAVPAQPAQSPGPSKQPVLETPQSTSVISLLKQKSNASSEPSPTPEVEAVDTNEAQPLLQVVSHENETGAAPERQAEGDHACGSGKETPERPQTGAQPGHKERTGTSARKRAGKNRAEPGSGRQPKRAKSSQDGHLPDIQDLLHKVIEVPFSVFK